MKDDITKFKVRLSGDRSYSLDAGKELKINRRKLGMELANHAARYAWYATLTRLALSERERREAALKALFARLAVKVRDGSRSRQSETEIKQRVLASEEYHKKLREFLRYKEQYRLLESVREAFEQRGEMLRSLNAKDRTEREQH